MTRPGPSSLSASEHPGVVGRRARSRAMAVFGALSGVAFSTIALAYLPTLKGEATRPMRAAVLVSAAPETVELRARSLVKPPASPIEPVATPPVVVGQPPSDGEAPPCVLQSPFSEVALARVLHDGHVRHFNVVPTFNRLACAWAHCALEHARGDHMFGNNIGHITTAGAWRGDHCVRRIEERVERSPNRWRAVDIKFRVYPTAVDGATDYWNLIASHYPRVLKLCERGDARSAAFQLGKRGYYTGPREPYANAMSRLFMEGLGNVLPRVERTFWEYRDGRTATPLGP